MLVEGVKSKKICEYPHQINLAILILGAYEQLRKSGFLELTHCTTFNQYISFTSSGVRFNPGIIKRLYDDLKVSTLQKYEKQTILLFDKIKIKSGLVYSKSLSCIVGFTELGDINEELNEFERKFQNSSTKSKELATYVICFMARRLMKRFSHPVGYLSPRGNSCFLLYGEPLGYLKQLDWKYLLLFAMGQLPTEDFSEHTPLKMD